ncbi:hypothetical protein [Lysobacter brunescens]|uniref:Secreted protein n=1 Tax=Lysobacter brunescens TaxID=262323 RepID=A0ABW2Y730_9GAMM
MTRHPIRRPLALLAALASLALPGLALADTYPCPNGPGPGDRQIGVTGGSHGIAAIPLCAYGDQGNGGEEDAPQQHTPAPDPMRLRIDASLSALTAMVANMEQQAALQRDPKYKRYREGFWDHFQASATPRPGQGCVAMFANLDGAVAVAGPGGEYTGAMLVFWGLDVPKPDKVATISVSLNQFDGPVQTVKALNYTLPGGTAGAIAFTVPTIDAALETMVDRQPFELSIKGQPVMKIEWHGGHAARDALRACVKGKR